METEELHDLVGDLTTNIDDLETALTPLTQKPISSTSSKLPLLDKAKLHVLATYALESVLFNSLRLNGADAKSHAVFAELNRVKEYFGKIKTAEGKGEKPTSRVDKDAAGRFIKAGLAGNEKHDREREERAAREKAGAKRKLEELSATGAGTHTRFDGAAKRIRTADEARISAQNSQDASEDEAEGGVALSESGAERKSKRKNKPSDPDKKQEKRARRQKAKEAKLSPHGTSDAAPQEQEMDVDEPAEKSSKPPKSSKEALDSLLDGASSRLEKKGKRKKKKSKGQTLEDARADEMNKGKNSRAKQTSVPISPRLQPPASAATPVFEMHFAALQNSPETEDIMATSAVSQSLELSGFSPARTNEQDLCHDTEWACYLYALLVLEDSIPNPTIKKSSGTHSTLDHRHFDSPWLVQEGCITIDSLCGDLYPGLHRWSGEGTIVEGGLNSP